MKIMIQIFKQSEKVVCVTDIDISETMHMMHMHVMWCGPHPMLIKIDTCPPYLDLMIYPFIEPELVHSIHPSMNFFGLSKEYYLSRFLGI